MGVVSVWMVFFGFDELCGNFGFDISFGFGCGFLCLVYFMV